ncbi:MAG: hypothetical protein A2Z72_08120 [Omnitrophica bacterium RBG_13_46_9]|nr:MAG: hypothetical protein A2Z72_08120 [Omnitrophica bacterium RBG_13_46_9]
MDLLKIILSIAIMVNCANYVYANDFEAMVKARSDEVVKGCDTFEEKARTLRQYVHDKMLLPDSRLKPDGTTLRPEDIYPLNTLQRVDCGWGGWCDQQVAVFMHFAQKQGITTRMVFLFKKGSQNSCHTITEALEGDRWVIVDPMFNLELINHDGKMASRDDIANDFNIIRNPPTVKQLAKKEPRWENDEEWLKIYSNPVSIKFVLEGEK